jgi:hypothetical protein
MTERRELEYKTLPDAIKLCQDKSLDFDGFMFLFGTQYPTMTPYEFFQKMNPIKDIEFNEVDERLTQDERELIAKVDAVATQIYNISYEYYKQIQEYNIEMQDWRGKLLTLERMSTSFRVNELITRDVPHLTRFNIEDNLILTSWAYDTMGKHGYPKNEYEIVGLNIIYQSPIEIFTTSVQYQYYVNIRLIPEIYLAKLELLNKFKPVYPQPIKLPDLSVIMLKNKIVFENVSGNIENVDIKQVIQVQNETKQQIYKDAEKRPPKINDGPIPENPPPVNPPKIEPKPEPKTEPKEFDETALPPKKPIPIPKPVPQPPTNPPMSNEQKLLFGLVGAGGAFLIFKTIFG